MTKGTYRKRIVQACKEAGTYKEQFDGVIDSLASILEDRDRARAQYKAMGYKPVLEMTSKAGTSMKKNPALVIITELNAQALQYWRELGLTVKAYQAMEKGGFKKPEKSFEEILSGIGV